MTGVLVLMVPLKMSALIVYLGAHRYLPLHLKNLLMVLLLLDTWEILIKCLQIFEQKNFFHEDKCITTSSMD